MNTKEQRLKIAQAKRKVRRMIVAHTSLKLSRVTNGQIARIAKEWLRQGQPLD